MTLSTKDLKNNKRREQEGTIDEIDKEKELDLNQEKKLPLEISENQEEEEEEEIGPMPVGDNANVDKVKRRKVLGFEKLYLKELPSATMYERSFMHREMVGAVAVAKKEFFITSSLDGYLKFWKKTGRGIEFVKQYKAHMGGISGMALSPDGLYVATIADDKAIKLFDVVSFDMINIIRLDYVPGTICFSYKPGDARILIACAHSEEPIINIYDGQSNSEPIYQIDNLHKSKITCMAYSPKHNIIISGSIDGMIEYFNPLPPHFNINFNDNLIEFEMKSETDLYDFKKKKSYPTNITFDDQFDKFVTVSFTSDRLIRVFKTNTAKLVKVFDESINIYNDLQQGGSEMYKLDPMEFGRRLVVEKEWPLSNQGKYANAVFDKSGNFIIYPSMLGIKMINLKSNRVVRLIGKNEAMRFINVGIYQGAPTKKMNLTVEMMASNNPLVEENVLTDPTLICTGYKRNRFYLFSHRMPESEHDTLDRDVFNEKPLREERTAIDTTNEIGKIGTQATIHTTFGDIHIELYPKEAPKTVLNFSGLSQKGFYDNLIFHRIIKSFMIQTGCPLGDGTGGDSIFGKEFEDEISVNLNFNQPYMVAMANAGKDTNQSQFFITTVNANWLLGKHTIFGKVKGGFDVIHQIENIKTDHLDRPMEEISIISIDIK